MIHIYANVLCMWVSIYTYNLITFQSVSSCVSGRQSVCRSPPAFSVETTLFWEPPTLSFRKRTGRDCSGWVVPLSRFLHGDPPHGVSLKAGNVFLTFLMCFLWGQSEPLREVGWDWKKISGHQCDLGPITWPHAGFGSLQDEDNKAHLWKPC